MEITEALTLMFTDCSSALRSLGHSVERTTQALRQYAARLEPMWAYMPGEWPDKFVLLNRYLRTGVKPPFLLNN